MRRTVEPVSVEQHSYLTHVQRVGNALCDHFQQRLNFYYGANLFGQLAKYLFRVIGVAEEPAVDPDSDPLGSAMEQEGAPESRR